MTPSDKEMKTADFDIETALEAVAAGDKEAFHSVVKATVSELRVYITFRLDDADAVDDLLQEVYLQAFQELHRYEAGTSFMAWLKTLAKYKVLQTVRRRQRRRNSFGRYLNRVHEILSRPGMVSGEDERGRLQERLQRLRSCLHKLSAPMANVITLYYFDQLKIAEVADRLDRTPSAVGMMLHRARLSLARCIRSGEES